MKKEITLEGVFHRIWYWVSGTTNIFLKLIISTVLGIGSKDIVYKLNQPLGEGYALWASYALTALIFIMIPNLLNTKKLPLNLKIKINKQEDGE